MKGVPFARIGKKLSALLLVAFLVCAVVPASAADGFRYVHDPCLNPKAMRDIVADDDAVYGFRPSETGSLKMYASADWSDPQIVEQGRRDRIAYHQSIEAMYEMLQDMQAQGKTTEEIARAVSTKRNEIRLAACADDPEKLAELKARNLEKYGHEEGPLPDELFAQYGSWTTVMEKAFSTNAGMDACLGLYDAYYFLYATLGDVPAQITVTIPASLYCLYKKTAAVTAQIESNVPNYQISFVSGDPAVASVDANGVVTGAARGETSVRCIVTDASGTVHESQPCAVSVQYTYLPWIVRCVRNLLDRMRSFIRRILGNKPVDVPADPPETIAAPDDGTEMHLAWNDEFGGDSLDSAKWTLRAKMHQSDIKNSDDERNVTVENGNLVMRTWKEADGTYSTNTSVTTDGTMSFQYGYLEIYANVPFVQGGWPSFWMSSKDSRRTVDYMTEIDMFEVYDTRNTVSSDIHKWYPGTDEHYHAGGRAWSYSFKRSINLNNEYHLYGLGWTPDELYFTVDGQIYFRYNLSQDFGDRGDGMQGFHDPVYIIFNNFIFTENSAWQLPPVTDGTKWPITYKIDWIRLYQKDGEGQVFDDTVAVD